MVYNTVHRRYRHNHDSSLSFQSQHDTTKTTWMVIKRGQNLSERYKRLERSLRGKVELGKGSTENETGIGKDTSFGIKTKEDVAVVFNGVEIRREPKAPGSEGE